MSGTSKDVAVAAGAADVTCEVLVVAVVVVGTAAAVTGDVAAVAAAVVTVAVASEAGVDDGRDEAGR